MGLSTVTLHGPLYLEDNQTPAQGTLSFTLSAPLQDLDNHRTVSPVPVEVTLDASGQFSVPLAATSGPNVVPDGVTYRCVYQPVGGPRVVLHFGLPPSPSSVNFSSLAPALPVSPSYSYALSAALNIEVARAEAAEALAVPLAQKGAANGVATLDTGSKIPVGQIPALPETDVTNLVADLAAEVTNRSAAITAEASTRAAADSAEASARAAADTSEASTRAAADTANANAISAETSRAEAAEGTNASAITAEASRAAAAEGLLKVGVNVLQYNDAAHAGTALQSAITAYTSVLQSGGHVLLYFPSGGYTWDVTPALPPGITGSLTIKFNDCLITLTSGGIRLLDFARTADYQTFQNINILGSPGTVIDVAGIGGRHHVILGNYIAGSFLSGQRANFNHIRIEDFRVVNSPVDSTTTNHRLGVFFQTTQITSGELTQNFFKDIKVRRCRFEGGNQGVSFFGACQAGGSNTNIVYDDIAIEDCWHSLLAAQPANFSSANYQIGSRASGGSCRISRCYGEYSGDVGIEIDGATRATVEDCEFLDAFGSPVYFTNLNAPSGGITAQTLNAVRTKVHHKALMAIHAPFDFDGGQGFGLGTCRMSDCEVVQESGIVSATPPADWAHFHGGIGAIDIDGFTGWTNGYNFTDPVTALSQFAIRVAPSPASNAATTVRMRKVTGRFDGTYSGVANTTWGLLSVAAGGNVILDVEASFSGSCVGGGGSFFRGADIGTGGTVGTIKGHAKIDIPTNAITGGAGAEAFVFRDTNPTLVAPFRISGDWAGCSTQVAFANSPTNKDKVFFEDYRPPTFPVLQTAISVTASPFTYQNLDGYAERVTIGNDNGPVTKIEISTDNSTFSDTKLTTGQFTLDNASAIRVTYSGSAPTMLKVPAK